MIVVPASDVHRNQVCISGDHHSDLDPRMGDAAVARAVG